MFDRFDRSPVAGSTVRELLAFVAASFVLSFAAVAQPVLLVLALAVLALVAAIALSLLNIKWAWCVFFLALCATGVQTTVGGLTVRPEYFAVPLFLASLYTHSRRDPTSLSLLPVHPGIYIGCAGFLASGIVSSALFAPDAATSLRMSVQLAVALLAVVPLLLVKLDIRFVVVSGTAILSAISVVGIMYFLVDASRRLSGLAFEYNVMGSLCLGWIALLYYFSACRTHTGRQIVDGRVMAMAIPIVAALILTSTRAAWVALAILFVYWAAQSFTHRPIVVAGSILACVVTLAVLQQIYYSVGDEDTFLWRLVHVIDTETGTGAYRLQIWNDAVAQLLARDWAAALGTGFNSFTQFNPIDPTNVAAAYLSSMWLAILYDTGIIGAAFVVVFLVSLFLSVRNKLRVLPLFVGLAVCTSVTSILWFAFPWVFLTLAANESLPERVPSAKQRRRTGGHRRRRALVTA